MKLLTAKFPGTCKDCGKAIKKGQAIKYYYRGFTTHANCAAPEETKPSEVTAPCWICKSPEGRFRNLGAATPVWCDSCHEIEIQKTYAHKISVTRFSSGAEVYVNSRGRCEDAPCCGCCS